MPYFLANNNLNIGQPAQVLGEEADHILLARRAKVGETVKVQGPDGKRFLAAIREIKKHEVVVSPEKQIPVPPEPGVSVVLFLSVVASGTLDVILQKATELGASEVVLFNSRFTATRLTSAKFREKLPRFQKILWEAAKQCERALPPVVSFADGLEGAISKSSVLDSLLVFDISGENFKPKILNPKSLGLVIGPEGGLSPDELKTLSALPNAQLVTLGPLLLKADTAAMATLAICQNLFN